MLSDEEKKPRKGLVRRFLPYYKNYVPILIFDLFCAAFTTVCELVLPLIVRFITNAGINDVASLTVSVIIKFGVLYLALRVIDTAANFYMASIGHVMGAKIETDMRRDMFGHLQKLSYSFYDNTKVGQLMSRITNDLFEVTEFAHHCPEEFFIAGIKIAAAFVILCQYSVWLTLIVFSVLPVMIVVLQFFNKRMRAGFRESRVKVGELNSQVEDSLLGIRVVKSFANEGIEMDKFEDGNTGFLKIKTRVYRYMAGFQATTRFFDGVMYIVIVVAGSLFMVKGKITPADLVAYLMYANVLLSSIRRIVEFAEQFQRGMTGIERFSEIMDTPASITDSPDAVTLENVRGEITFENVSFSYSEETDSVLKDVNIRIAAGENAALVGPSGGGKTTLCSLIPRFYDTCGGSIKIDGEDIRDFTLSSLRGQIGVVAQDVYLFSGSVRDNIEYGKPGATDKEICEAAKLAGAEEFIGELPNGYDTYVGERGVKLSGGQKQRISIARVFLKNPPILILDEATSSLDNESEKLVQQSLERLAKGRTTLTIAHRLTTIRNADTILVLTKNGIAEQGTHSALLAQKGIYAGLYEMYAEKV
ncbi:MAG TPA: ABC transporter ATP-binding protein [Oscillospiraceae bacterium]|nr:ABC transporter ATP-binding protein [Oscillospiraceae bacterium]